MGQIVDEVRQWNTPVIGAFLLWRFTQGYRDAHPNGDAPVALLHFLATAILTDSLMTEFISNKRGNLQAYVRGFEDKKISDILLSLQKRILDRREYTLESIDIAVSTGLIILDLDQGKLYPCAQKKKASRGNALKASMATYGNKAEILGKWFSAHDISTIAAYMEVVF